MKFNPKYDCPKRQLIQARHDWNRYSKPQTAEKINFLKNWLENTPVNRCNGKNNPSFHPCECVIDWIEANQPDEKPILRYVFGEDYHLEKLSSQNQAMILDKQQQTRILR